MLTRKPGSLPGKITRIIPEYHYPGTVSKLNQFNKFVATKDELWKRIESIVNETNVNLCKELIATMPERVIDVIRAKGGYTRW